MKDTYFTKEVKSLLSKKLKTSTDQIGQSAWYISQILRQSRHADKTQVKLLDEYLDQIFEHIEIKDQSAVQFLNRLFDNLSTLMDLSNPFADVVESDEGKSKRNALAIKKAFTAVAKKTKELQELYKEFPEFKYLEEKGAGNIDVSKIPQHLRHLFDVHLFCKRVPEDCERFIKVFASEKKGPSPRQEMGVFLVKFEKSLTSLITKKKKNIIPLAKNSYGAIDFSIFAKKNSSKTKYKVSALRIIVNGCYLLGANTSFHETSLAKRLERAKTLPIKKYYQLPREFVPTSSPSCR